MRTFPRALRDAGLASAVALVLGIPLVGLRVFPAGPEGLEVEGRWTALAIGVAAVFAGRLLLSFMRLPAAAAAALRAGTGAAAAGLDRKSVV